MDIYICQPMKFPIIEKFNYAKYWMCYVLNVGLWLLNYANQILEHHMP